MAAFAAATAISAPSAAVADTTYPYQLNSSALNVGFGSDGSIQSLLINGDLFPTQYVLNPDDAPQQAAEPNVKLRQWMGNALFSYALGSGTPTVSGVGSTPWSTAWTTASADGRTVTSDGKSVTVTYQNSTDPQGVKNFTFTENYSLDATGSLVWKQTVTNTSSQRLVIGDWGVPLPDNEIMSQGGEVYEQRVISHSNISGDSGYVTWQRPSGQGPSIVISSDTATGSGFEYLNRWETDQVGDTAWADKQSYSKGLNVAYVHSMAIQKQKEGYLPSTALSLNAGDSQTYSYRIAKVNSDQDRHDQLFNQGLVDFAVAPSMVVPYDEKAELALRVKGTITSITGKNQNDLGGANPTNPKIALSRSNASYSIYDLTFDKTQLGNNYVTVAYTDQYGNSRSTVMQFQVIDNPGAALQQHADFMVNNQQWTTANGISATDIRNGTYDDWMFNAADGSLPTAANPPAGKRNNYAGYWGLGDDWGLTHGEFLAEMNAVLPNKTQVQSLDLYTEKGVWENLMCNTPNDATPSYLVYDFYESGKPCAQNDTPTYRGFAYPHIYNTFFSMYKIAKQNPNLITYSHPAVWYLNVAYNIFKELYDGPVAYNWNTGLMGEQSTPDIIAALQNEGMTTQANDMLSKMATKYANFSGSKYPYGSEYSYDNTGEEGVYTMALMNVNIDTPNALRMMRDIVTKTTADRGQQPIWYWYANPVTTTGENWWNFQYSAALAGYTMDNYINHTSALETGTNAVSDTDRAVLERTNYAGKLANLTNINSGQISNNPANVGASAWSYQAQKGIYGTNGLGSNYQLLNGWRGQTGESDLGLWGALQTISTDVVTDDPIFGTVAYGGNVTSDANSSTVTPTDGVQRRLNMVTQQLSMELGADQFTSATVAKNNADLNVTLKNNAGDKHQGSMTVTGLAQGTYAIQVNGTQVGTVNNYTPLALSGKLAPPVVATYTTPAAATYTVHLVPTTPPANTAPVVSAGPDQTGAILGLDTFTLAGTATDDGLGNPNGTLNTTWSLVSAPAGQAATIAAPSNLITGITPSGAGAYTFRLTATDGALASTDDVTVTVGTMAPMPANWVNYTFDSANGNTVPDTSGNGNNLTLNGATVGVDGAASVLKFDGAKTSYAQLPNDIMTRSAAGSTIITTVKLTAAPTTWARIWDFGSGTNKYMNLSPMRSNGNLGFGMTVQGGSFESDIWTGYTMPLNQWVTVKLTFSPNGDGTTTGTLYADGVQVGQNTSMPINPVSLGRTQNNYVGKSQFDSDPAFQGEIDSFQILGSANAQSQVTPGAVTVTGNPVVGSTLTANGGTWVPSTTALTYQWNSDGTPVTGATATTYTPVTADIGHAITVTVTGAAVGCLNSSATSLPTAAVTAPAVTATVSITSSGAAQQGWYQQSVIVALAPPATGQKVQYQVGGGAWKSYGSAITLSKNGTTTIGSRLLVNNVVVTGSTLQTPIQIDKTRPTITATALAGTKGTPMNPVSFAFAASDTYSGVASMQYQVNGGAWIVAGNDPLVLNAVGNYVVTYRATDVAGNVSTSGSVSASVTANVPTTVKATVKTVTAGSPLTATFAGFPRWSTLTVYFGTSTAVATVMTDVNGTAKLTFTVPTGTPLGSQTLAAVDSTQTVIGYTTVAVK